MGRKGQGFKQQQTVKLNNQRNLSNVEKDLHDNIDKLLRISTVPQQTNVLKALQSQREIYTITEKIKSLQSDDKFSIDNRLTRDIIDEFTTWAIENGAELNGCSISQFDGYDLGLKVNTDISRSSLVVAVPRKLMLSVETASRSILRDIIEKDQILKNMPNVTLAIFLLVQKFKETSFWKPYINILPENYTTVLYFTIEELEELKGSPTLELALKQIKNIARQYAYFHKLFATSENAVSRLMRNRFTYKEYCWAVSTVMTRQNTVPSEDGTKMVNALIPLWDICNHANGTISTDYNPQLDRSECLALRDFKVGEQLFIFYGARTNADLFIHNGFVYEENLHDGYVIRLGISKSDPLQKKRNELLSRLSIPSTTDFFIKEGPRPVDQKLLAFLRIFNMDEEQLQHWLDSNRSTDLFYDDCALNTALEKKSWSFLQARLKLLLSTYKTTLEEDIQILLEESLTSANKMLAVKMRMTEKKIIKDALEYSEQIIRQ